MVADLHIANRAAWQACEVQKETQSMQYVVRFHVGCGVPNDMQPFEDNEQVRPTARTNTSLASVVCSRCKKQDWQSPSQKCLKSTCCKPENERNRKHVLLRLSSKKSQVKDFKDEPEEKILKHRNICFTDIKAMEQDDIRTTNNIMNAW